MEYIMSVSFELHAVTRTDVGKGASRRLRRDNKVPAIVYGHHTEPTSLTLEHNKVVHALAHEAFYSHILTLHVGGVAEKVVLKAVHRHPYKPVVLHMDFQRVSATEKIIMHVPLHFINEDKAPGMADEGILTKQLTDVEVRCFPGDLPEYIEVDCAHLAMDQILHLSDLSLPKGIELVAMSHGAASHDYPVVSIHHPHVVKEDEEKSAVAAAPEAAVGDEEGSENA
jgi:large subunit ribosomal protein L25